MTGNVLNTLQTHALLHAGENVLLCDAGHQDKGKRPEITNKTVDWYVATRPVIRIAKSWLRPRTAFQPAARRASGRPDHC